MTCSAHCRLMKMALYCQKTNAWIRFFHRCSCFFDYDFQNKMGTQKVNNILYEMLDFFNDETENGKLYINYPMIESLKYTKEMPDAE